MTKKKKDTVLYKRFNSDDVNNWQKAANNFTGGNLTLWVELRLNEAAKKDLKLSEKGRV
jgi:hypothetical protein